MQQKVSLSDSRFNPFSTFLACVREEEKEKTEAIDTPGMKERKKKGMNTILLLPTLEQ